jgi:DnaJ-class molecular chaperone
VRVTPEPGLRLDGINVVSDLEISLLDALRGCKKTVNTIQGDKEIEIQPQSRHKDEVVIPHLGVNGAGNQRVILDVKYPSNVGNLIDVLA